MSSSSYQPSAVSPTGPSTSSTNTRNAKLDQIIQNFYTKTAQIVIQARCTPDNGRRASLKGSSNKKLNKWFNIATEDIDVLREDLKLWRSMVSQTAADKQAPPMIIDIYLDTSKLSHNQSLLVADDNLRWSCIELKSQTTDSHIHRILIESWELTLNHPLPDYAVDLPNLYKRSIVFFRTLHSLARLLPAYDLYRKLHKLDSSNPLSIGYRLATATQQQNPTEISLGSTILESDARKPTKLYEFSNIVTPIGTMKLNVAYRRNCDFRVEDVERDLSAQFIDMDEQFFTPTMVKYQQLEQLQKEDAYHTSLGSKVESALKQKHPDDDFPPSPTNRHRQPSIRSLSPTNSTSANRRLSGQTIVSPFKSPFLSSSPQTESMFSNKNQSPSSLERSRPVINNSAVDSGSYGRKIEFSSSFDKYKASPTNRTDSPSSVSMMRRWSRTSDHGSINFKNEHDEHDDLEEFVKLVGSNQELRLFQPTRSTLLSSESSNSSMMMSVNKKSVLSHFQNLKETHNNLSESLSSSMIISQHHEPVSGISPVSSTSSTGRSYQPIIPSPLHAKQKSTSPVHIPRSLPQLRSQNVPRMTRLNPTSSHQEKEQDHDISAYSTYPQGAHQDLRILRNTGHSEYQTGKVSNKGLDDDPSGSRSLIQRSSLIDDDDSLVFKMSELECEGPPPPTPPTPPSRQNELPLNRLNNNNNNRLNEQYLELTPTPLSPPLLHRLQSISMSTVKEEEEKSGSMSASGSSNKSIKYDTW